MLIVRRVDLAVIVSFVLVLGPLTNGVVSELLWLAWVAAMYATNRGHDVLWAFREGTSGKV